MSWRRRRARRLDRHGVEAAAGIGHVPHRAVDQPRVDAADGERAVALAARLHADGPHVLDLARRDELREDVLLAAHREAHHAVDLLELVEVGRLLGDRAKLDRDGPAPARLTWSSYSLPDMVHGAVGSLRSHVWYELENLYGKVAEEVDEASAE